MSDLMIWITLAGLTLVTIATRAGFQLLPASWQLPPRMQRALRYAPACALAAIVAPDLLMLHGELHIAPDNARLWAGSIAIALFAVTRSMMLTIVGGMLAFTALRFVLAA